MRLVAKIFVVLGVLLSLWAFPVESSAEKLRGSLSAFIHCGKLECERAALWIEGIFRDYLGEKWLSPEQLFALLPADLDEKRERLKKLYSQGKRAFDDLNPELAQKKFRQLLAESRGLGPHLRKSELKLLVNTYLLLGVVDLMSGNERTGKEHFERALLLSPSVKLSSLIDEKDKLATFRTVRRELSSRPLLTITFKSYPRAEVFLNGEFVGVTPLRYQLRAGEHYVVFKRDGFFSTGKFVKFKGRRVFRMSLRPIGEWKRWEKLGAKAAQHTGPAAKYPHPVKVMAELTQTNYILVASVKTVGGEKFEVRAAIYDAESQRQLSWGGAFFQLDLSGKGVIRELIKKLSAGQNPQLNGWSPSREPPRRVPPPPKLDLSKVPPKKGSSAGLWIGLGLGTAAVVGAGAAILILYLTRPKCSSDTGCLELELK